MQFSKLVVTFQIEFYFYVGYINLNSLVFNWKRRLEYIVHLTNAESYAVEGLLISNGFSKNTILCRWPHTRTVSVSANRDRRTVSVMLPDGAFLISNCPLWVWHSAVQCWQRCSRCLVNISQWIRRPHVPICSLLDDCKIGKKNEIRFRRRLLENRVNWW